MDDYAADAVISLVAPRSYRPTAARGEVCPITIEESLGQSDFSVATTTVTAANQVSGNRALGSTACCSCIAEQPEEGKQPRPECKYKNLLNLSRTEPKLVTVKIPGGPETRSRVDVTGEARRGPVRRGCTEQPVN